MPNCAKGSKTDQKKPSKAPLYFNFNSVIDKKTMVFLIFHKSKNEFKTISSYMLGVLDRISFLAYLENDSLGNF